MNQHLQAITAYMDIMKIGKQLSVRGPAFREAYPRREGYATHEEVFLDASPGSNFGAWTVQYVPVHDAYVIQRNELGSRRVFASPEYRDRYIEDRDGYLVCKEEIV